MTLRTNLAVTDHFRPEYLEYYGVLPIDVVGGALQIAAADTPPREVLEDMADLFGGEPQIVESSRDEINDAVRIIFSAAESTDALVRSLEDIGCEDGGLGESVEADARDLANQPPVIRYVNLLIREAYEARSSDIHFEAGPEGPRVRFRIDGVLTPATAPPMAIQAAVISRFKLVADLDIAERRVPQDGRVRVRFEHGDLDLRVSTVPTLFGESIVLRLLDQGRSPEGLGRLGMPEDVHGQFTEAARSPHGIVLATGPTGSGKTTTLYCALRARETGREKVITIEDPIEYRLPGVTQVPVKERSGMTFASGLRSILRQDPDVIMVGEMRDHDTAHTAIQAAMTGHVVFSTVHTNDAASAVIRLVDLGIEPYLVAATLRGVLAQRLVRRVCDHCAEESDGTAALKPLFPHLDIDRRVRTGTGCALCRGTGFKGRTGLFEFLAVNEAVRAQIVRDPDVSTLRDLARKAGMRSLAADGRTKVLDGVTTSEEVLRAIQA